MKSVERIKTSILILCAMVFCALPQNAYAEEGGGGDPPAQTLTDTSGALESAGDDAVEEGNDGDNTENVSSTENPSPGETTENGDAEDNTPAGDEVNSEPEESTHETSSLVAVNGVGYATLEDAVAAAEPGATITVLADLDLTDKRAEVITFPDNVIFDLGGHTISTANMGLIYQGNNLTIRNGTFYTAPGESYALFVGDEAESDGVLLEDIQTEGGINIYDAINVTLRNVTAVGHDYYAVWADAHAMVTIESGDYSTSENSIDVFGISTLGGSYIHVYGGVFTTTRGNLVLENYTPPVLYGGLYNVDPTAYVAPDVPVTPLPDGWFKVGEDQITVEVTPLDPDTEVSAATMGVVDADSVKDILLAAVDPFVVTGKEVRVELDISPLVADAVTEQAFASRLASAHPGAQLANFFDVDINVIDVRNGVLLDTITELDQAIELMVLLPADLQNHDASVMRTYYILREHDGVVEILGTTLAADGKSLTFRSDKFSTYALAYLDTYLASDENTGGSAGASGSQIGSQTPGVGNTGANTATSPKTNDAAGKYWALLVFSLMGLGGAVGCIKVAKETI